MAMDRELMARLKREVDERLVAREAETIEYWLGQLSGAYERKHANLAALQVELQALMEKMRTRLKALKSYGNV